MSQAKLSLLLLAASLLAISCVRQTLAADKYQCYKCDSTTDPNCLKADLTGVTQVECENGCETRVVSGKNGVTRGCLSAAPAECKDDVSCYKCTSNGCNNQNVCVSCDSSNDKLCAQQPNAVATVEVCSDKDTKCLITIESKKTIRRCATKNAADVGCSTANTATCQACAGGKCNFQVFPDNHLSCYQCADTDTKCANVIANSVPSLPCVLYDPDDKCYTYGTEATKMMRGCVSDVDPTNKCGTNEASTACQKCSVSNCNQQEFMTKQTLKCHNCEGKADESNNVCVWGQVGAPMDCTKLIKYDSPQECYTQIKDGVVYRGCVVDRATTLGECNTATNCDKCTESDGCNKQDRANVSCIRCRSDAFAGCWNNADKIGGEACTNAVSQNSAAGCYRGIWNGVAIRGCLIDADERMKFECGSKDFSHCTTCPTANCNTEKSSSGVGTITVAPLALLLVAVAAILRP